MHCVALSVDANISNIHGAFISELCNLLLGLHNLEEEGTMVQQDIQSVALLHSITPQKTKIIEYFLPCNFAVSVLGLLSSRQLTSRLYVYYML